MTTITESRYLKSALIYASKLDWEVFPLVPKSKKPITEHGFQDATKDGKQIINWWKKYPDANIGIATGTASGFFALDVDPRHNGDVTLEELLDHYQVFPDTVQAITGSGGSHYLFKYREGVRSRNDLQPGIDIKGDGGYIVAPPSIHPDTGETYEWELSSRPIENQITEAPEWLLNMVLEPKKDVTSVKPSTYWEGLFNNTKEGNRTNAATSLVGHLFRRYVDPILVVEFMKLWNESKVAPPLEEESLIKVINSIAGKELRRRGGKE
ncbi:bifunctional DNA primase/polymerase [Lentibacillus sediminis]|uniref:bifunctional DNA primase/polymerase n=1 Tax=Lentibacillus sediminis TaxID=1940529 RepID=UPI001303F891|nr:bifunctional DNA primase/polymerase [Lentibacillus sediminis]